MWHQQQICREIDDQIFWKYFPLLVWFFSQADLFLWNKRAGLAFETLPLITEIYVPFSVVSDRCRRSTGIVVRINSISIELKNAFLIIFFFDSLI